jgi:hypothetical protein
VERCEVTGIPLCAQHLWYADDGRRISQTVARQLGQSGVTVYSPQTYLSTLGAAVELPRLPMAPPSVAALGNNNHDVIAALAFGTGMLSIATCFGDRRGRLRCPAPRLVPLIPGWSAWAARGTPATRSGARLFSWTGIGPGRLHRHHPAPPVAALAFGITGPLQTLFTRGVLRGP